MLVTVITLISVCLFGLTTATEVCADVACPQGFPVCDEGKTLIDVSRPGDCCPEYECVGQVCTPADSYYTLPDYPCMYCRCGPDGQPTDDCDEMACYPPLCPAGQWATPIPGTCCGFEECTPIPECAEVACIEGFPVCGEGTTLVDRRGPNDCCPVYECVGQVCTPGEFYTSPDNPCLSCKCGKSGRPTDLCATPGCAVPSCPFGQVSKHREGTCCGADCVLETWVVIVVAVLGAVIVLGSILALVFCCWYKKKQNATSPRTEQYYNNLNYRDVDDKKKVPLDSVYVDKDINDAKLQKEKEALQNA